MISEQLLLMLPNFFTTPKYEEEFVLKVKKFIKLRFRSHLGNSLKNGATLCHSKRMEIKRVRNECYVFLKDALNDRPYTKLQMQPEGNVINRTQELNH